MILCETFWKPSLADFAKQHKQTIYSIFLQVLFLCLALCFQAPLPAPLSKLLSLCLLAFVSDPGSSFSSIMSPPLTPPPVAITNPWAIILGGGSQRSWIFHWKKERKKGGREEEWSLLLSLLPLVLRKYGWEYPSEYCYTGLRQTQYSPQERPW